MTFDNAKRDYQTFQIRMRLTVVILVLLGLGVLVASAWLSGGRLGNELSIQSSTTLNQ